MRTHILIAALILSTSVTAQAANTRGLIVKQPPAAQQPTAVPAPTYQTQAAPPSAVIDTAPVQTEPTARAPLESVVLQPVAPHPAQHVAINGTHNLPTAQAQPQASQQRLQMQAQQQQMQRQRLQQQRMQQMQAQRMRQQEMQRHEMQRQQMARDMSLEEKVDYKVKEVKLKLKEKLVGALFK
jgi:signal transduction histidine kinase